MKFTGLVLAALVGTASAQVYSGTGNTNEGATCFIGGGDTNSISEKSENGVIPGGQSNEVTGDNAVVGGGRKNRAYSNYATVAGGYANRASGRFSAIPGGSKNTASGRFSLAAGFNALATGDYSGALSFQSGTDVCTVRSDNTLAICADTIDITGDLQVNGVSISGNQRRLEDDAMQADINALQAEVAELKKAMAALIAQ